MKDVSKVIIMAKIKKNLSLIITTLQLLRRQRSPTALSLVRESCNSEKRLP